MRVVKRELVMGLLLGIALFVVGFLRVSAKFDVVSSLAIGVTLYVIVASATITGTLIPLGLNRLGIDPAHAGPTIQVVMDVSGVLLTCVVCSFFFGSVLEPEGIVVKEP